MRDGAKTRAKIEAEALRLFAEKGIDGTSMRDISAAVGVAEGAIYRHFPGKEALARAIFLKGYSELAASVLKAGDRAKPFEQRVKDVVDIFCTLFDENRPLFSFLLISQHAHLAKVPLTREENVAEAVHSVFVQAMAAGEIVLRDADLLTSMALGIVSQPAVFTIYGRLQGSMRIRSAILAEAVIAITRPHRDDGLRVRAAAP